MAALSLDPCSSLSLVRRRIRPPPPPFDLLSRLLGVRTHLKVVAYWRRAS